MGNAASGLKPMVNSEITVRLKTDKTNPKTTLNGTLVGVSGNNIIVNDRDCDKNITLSLNTYATDKSAPRPPPPASPLPQRDMDDDDMMPPPRDETRPPAAAPAAMVGGRRTRSKTRSSKSKSTGGKRRRNKTAKA